MKRMRDFYRIRDSETFNKVMICVQKCAKKLALTLHHLPFMFVLSREWL